MIEAEETEEIIKILNKIGFRLNYYVWSVRIFEEGTADSTGRLVVPEVMQFIPAGFIPCEDYDEFYAGSQPLLTGVFNSPSGFELIEWLGRFEVVAKKLAKPIEEQQMQDSDKATYTFNEDDINTRFTYHPPKEGQPQKYQDLRDIAKSFATAICRMCPDSREKSLALTKLEESVMWANASIARNE